MSEQASHLWKPIEDLPSNAAQLASAQTASLIAAWKEHVKDMKDRRGYEQFLVRLRRKWAIETGILERLYSLSEGATKTLIEKGFDEALISHDDTDRPPNQVIALIRDQHKAIEGLYQFISGDRPLGTSYIKELHRVLTEHQPRYDAIDTLGNPVERDLPRGEWKKFPNNVEGPDGFTFQFCPPEHVNAEMDRLLEMHEAHQRVGVPPDVEAAWLHHRFTLIHPFTDGNGRVARCLASLILLKAEWFPLVVSRDDRSNYIGALRGADKGDMGPLVKLFDLVQERSITQGFTISATLVDESSQVDEILQAAVSKLKLTKTELQEKHKQVVDTAAALYVITVDRFKELAKEIDQRLGTTERSFHAHADSAAYLEPRAHQHDDIIWDIARAAGYRPALMTYDAWGMITIDSEVKTTILVSIHGIGDQSGVLACSGIAGRWGSSEEPRGYPLDPKALGEEPFYFTYLDSPDDVIRRYRLWLERIIVAGLNYWRRAIGA